MACSDGPPSLVEVDMMEWLKNEEEDKPEKDQIITPFTGGCPSNLPPVTVEEHSFLKSLTRGEFERIMPLYTACYSIFGYQFPVTALKDGSALKEFDIESSAQLKSGKFFDNWTLGEHCRSIAVHIAKAEDDSIDECFSACFKMDPYSPANLQESRSATSDEIVMKMLLCGGVVRNLLYVEESDAFMYQVVKPAFPFNMMKEMFQAGLEKNLGKDEKQNEVEKKDSENQKSSKGQKSSNDCVCSFCSNRSSPVVSVVTAISAALNKTGQRRVNTWIPGNDRPETEYSYPKEDGNCQCASLSDKARIEENRRKYEAACKRATHPYSN